MKKLLEALKNFFASLGIGSVKDVIEKVEGQAIETIVVNSLNAVKDKDPKLAASIVDTLKAWAPYLQDAASKTATTIDDTALKGLLAGLDDYAKEVGLT